MSAAMHKQAQVRRWITFGCLAVIVGVYVYQTLHYWHYINDDAYIAFRYSRFLALGRGPYFNVGERVEGYTSLSLMLIITPVIRFFGADAALPAAKSLGVVSGILSIVLAFFLTRSLLRKADTHLPMAEFWGLCASGFTGVNAAYALNSTSGLETTMFSFCLILAALLATRETSTDKWHGSGFAFGAAILTRPEGILLWFVFWLAQAVMGVLQRLFKVWRTLPLKHLFSSLFNVRASRLLLINCLTVAVMLALQLLFRYHFYDGEWLPNTYYAKAGGFLKENAWPYISNGIIAPFFGLIGIALSLIGFGLNRKTLFASIPVGVMAVTGSFLPFVTGTDWMLGWRFVIPYLPLMASFVVAGWAVLIGSLLRHRAWLGLSLLVAGVIAQWFIQAADRAEFYRHTRLRAEGYQTGHIALADWLRDETSGAGQSIALMDIGIVGYLCIDWSIIDLTGLTDRFIAHSKGEFLQKEYDPKYILDRRPTFIVLTVTAPGHSYGPLPLGSLFRFWTKMEERLYLSPAFQRSYVRHSSATVEPDERLRPLAQQLGAERIFEHAYPGSHYLLAVFRCNPSVK
jgi:arabinofuranosyltransferase